MDIATLLVSAEFQSDNKVMPFSEIILHVREYMTNFCKENGINYSTENEITYNSTKIIFYLNYSPKVHQYFLCIIPKNVWVYSSKKVLVPAFNETVDFFNKIPASIKIGDIVFSKPSITGNIDISKWSFTTNPDVGINNVTQIKSFPEIQRLGKAIFSKKIGTLNKNLILIDSGGIINLSKRNRLRDRFAPLFLNNEIIPFGDTVLENMEKRTDINSLFVIFFGNKKSNDECYGLYKQYFISKGIPSQFVNTENVDKILSFGSENLLFEILKKTQKEDAISLDPVLPLNVDALLCLSDIGTLQNKVFGISVSLTGTGETSEWLEVYNDIIYQTRYNDIRFEQGEVTKLGNKIEALSNLQGKTIDIFVTKRWRTADVGYLCRVLEKYNITIRKFLYIGSKANKFLFSSLPREDEMQCIHPYIIWGERVASIQTNSKLQLYGTMFPVYIELLNPWNGKLSEDDLKMVLWLVKKRIYRIANFYNLKVPELVTLLDQAKKLNINNVSGRLRISLHTLI